MRGAYFSRMDPATSSSQSSKFWFWSHLLLVVLAWSGPLLADWYIMSAAYGLVYLQFAIFDRCLVNVKHDLDEEGEMTFYAQLLESAGIYWPRMAVRRFVRRWLYLILAGIGFLVQEIGGFVPLIHFPLG